MATDREFTHPGFGSQVRVEVRDREVALIFVASSDAKAIEFADNLIGELEQGSVTLTLMGRPTDIVED